MIPYPFSADDHQVTNAEIFSKPGAAELWVQDDLNEENFAEQITSLIQDWERLASMSTTMKSLAIPDASERVCDVITAKLS